MPVEGPHGVGYSDMETAPRDGRTVILTDGIHVTAGWFNPEKKRWEGGGTVEHWMTPPIGWMPLTGPTAR